MVYGFLLAMRFVVQQSKADKRLIEARVRRLYHIELILSSMFLVVGRMQLRLNRQILWFPGKKEQL